MGLNNEISAPLALHISFLSPRSRLRMRHNVKQWQSCARGGPCETTSRLVIIECFTFLPRRGGGWGWWGWGVRRAGRGNSFHFISAVTRVKGPNELTVFARCHRANSLKANTRWIATWRWWGETKGRPPTPPHEFNTHHFLFPSKTSLNVDMLLASPPEVSDLVCKVGFASWRSANNRRRLHL